MAQNPKDGKLLYHLTALKNLESIISQGLQPRKQIKNFFNVADKEILKDREKYDLSLYTPFHFFSKSPFSGVVQLTYPDEEFVYIAITRDLAKSNKFKVIPSHPLSYQSDPLEWEVGIKSIDWDLMAERNYNNARCKEVCMAEAIFYGTVPKECFNSIYVKSENTEKKVNQLLNKYNYQKIHVNLQSGMFINND